MNWVYYRKTTTPACGGEAVINQAHEGGRLSAHHFGRVDLPGPMLLKRVKRYNLMEACCWVAVY